MRMKILSTALLLILSLCLNAAPINIPMGANAYVTKNEKGAVIRDAGVTNWTDAGTVISSYFHMNKTGKMNLSIRAKSFDENTKVNVTVAGKTYPITLHSQEWTVYPVANDIAITKVGHIKIDMQGVEKKGEFFAEVSDLIVDGSALEIEPNYVKDFSYHFGRRGPSVHLSYKLPEEDVEYFYNEITVPVGEDVIGSYYMANGFSGGYFGMQVNSETERRVLFSVWSPFDTQDPKLIPEDDRILTNAKGKDVHIGEFGNEGSGGQSYLRYPWKAGNTYKFLLQVRPNGNGKTTFTAYFYATDEKEWRLIASFIRPKTDTWYKGAYSFLENFSTHRGHIQRKVLFGNQWARTAKGKWVEVTGASFSHDATANAKKRMDYRGGMANEDQYFLENCGFFDGNTKRGTPLERRANKKAPKINFGQLKKLQNKK